MYDTLYRKARKLMILNDVLRYVGILLCIYLLLLPYLPELSYAIEGTDTAVIDTTAIPADVQEALNNGIDYLAIPSIAVGEIVMEAQSIKEVHEKIWRRPQGSTPDAGSNTVMVAHRYATIGGNRASTFYHLPKMVQGDMIYVVWKGKLYTYRVSGTDTVMPDQVEIEGPTESPRLTLYTCTPLWTATKRFVVYADLVQ